MKFKSLHNNKSLELNERKIKYRFFPYCSCIIFGFNLYTYKKLIIVYIYVYLETGNRR